MGSLEIEDFPYAQPAFGPSYKADAIPAVTRERWELSVAFEPGEQGQAFIDSLLPPGVEPAMDPPVASIWTATHAHSTLGGPYRETGAGVLVDFEETTYMYPFCVYLNEGAEVWYSAGREVWGHQKRFGHTSISEPENNGVLTGRLEYPEGRELVELSVGPLDREAEEEEIQFFPVLTLRVIPSPEGPEPETAQLVVTDCDITPRRGSDGALEFWAGPGEINFPYQSDRDPFHKLDPDTMIESYYGCYDGIITPYGEIVKEYI